MNPCILLQLVLWAVAEVDFHPFGNPLRVPTIASEFRLLKFITNGFVIRSPDAVLNGFSPML
jgi:hypothetical protein